MTPDNDDTILAHVRLKDAALYFKYVVPDLTYYTMRLIGRCLDAITGGYDPSQVVAAMAPLFSYSSDLLPPELRSDKRFVLLSTKLPVWHAINVFMTMLPSHPQRAKDFEFRAAQLADAVRALLRVNVLDREALDLSYNAFCDLYGLDSLPVALPVEWIEETPETTEAVDRKQSHFDYRISLMNVKLVDTSKASWEQILEFRNDTDSHASVIRLCRFMNTAYAGKEKSFIEDDLCSRMERHNEAAAKFGFDLKATVLEAVCSSKVLQTSIAGAAGIAAASANLGGALTAGALAIGAVTAAFEGGNAWLKLERRKFEYNQYLASHPLGYLIAAKEQLENAV
jgi:hypothetical protein